MLNKVNIKPLSVNKAWKGRRFKTTDYTMYERELSIKLPKTVFIPNRENFGIKITWGMSNFKASDFDNPIKPFVDVLQKKYMFNDNAINEAIIKKVQTKKGEEFIEFEFY